ncbi:serine/threonine-protein kinase [Thermogemmata fonticola]|uniref:Tetratricopeptide repeat protein n=1 Tax=Thermogemmata fonticola TaxID=2755323 RepID=A0A7V9AA18_9BACT|nr:serine/threonine-protein kinase [Thermogemmata fonticola]MBA2224583.1 tetratricopeptide repeat protein [Thermogemmata fonticola]
MASLTSVAEPLLPAVPGYQLVDEIGRGGMGVVYRARDLRLNREVAIKSLNPKYAADSAVATRFQAEAQLTGQLQHPGIPAVHELGTLPDNRPFLAMKLVKGRTLQELLKERDDLPSPSGRGAGGEGAERGRFIAIFEQICHAVGYVHAHHVIHRDLKPSNVMVGAFGEVQVMDWGLAKVIDPNRKTERPAEEEDDPEATAAFVTAIDTPERGGSATRTGSVLGTPAYMAPEQAAGQIRRLDARSDVFGLGAILCQILTGHPPYEGTDDNERRVKAVRGELGEAFARLEACGAEPELVALCKRCLAFRQEDRPRDGNAVAAEVAAIRQAAEERARRAELERTRAEVAAAEQAKRRRLVQWAGGLIAAVLLLGLGISLWQMNRAITAEAAAREERDAKAKALEAETIARQRAMTALRTLTDDIVENQMARAETLTEENKAFLKKIIEHFEGFAAITANDAESRAIRAEGHARVGLMRYRLGDLKEAEAAYTAALDIHKQLADEFPTRPEFRQALARSHNNLGVLLADTGRLKEAEAAYTAARDIQKQLADEFPTRPDFRQELAQSHNNLGVLLRATGRLKEAEAAYRDALDLRKQLAAEFPTRPDFRQELAQSHNNLGVLLDATGRLKEAEAAYTAALDIRKQLAAEFPTRPEFRQELAISHNNLGVLLRATGRLKEAEAAYRDALDLRKQLVDEFPTRPDFRQELAISHNNLGNLLRETGRLKEAEAAYTAARDIQKQLAAEFPTRPDFRQELAQSHNNLGVLLDATGRLKEAEAAYTAALDIRKQLAAEFPTNLDLRNELAGTCVNLALLCNQRREFKAAKQHLAEGEPHHQAALEANSRNPTYRQFYRNHLWALTEAHAGLGEQADALKAAQRVRDLGWDPPKNAYDAACGLALCIPIVAKDEQLDADKRKAAVQFYGDQAMKLLREAVEKGFKNVEHMKKDTDLDPLREREDFQKLLAELPQPAARLLDMVHDVGAGLKLSGQLNRNTGTLIYQVRLEKDVEYVIGLTSPDPKALDPYLLVSDDKNKQLAEDADSGGNQNARLVFRAPADGVYRLHATSYNQGQGDFTLTVRRKE